MEPLNILVNSSIDNPPLYDNVNSDHGHYQHDSHHSTQQSYNAPHESNNFDSSSWDNSSDTTSYTDSSFSDTSFGSDFSSSSTE